MTITVAIAQKKGGATKTTTALNLAGALMEKGFSVRIADMNTEQQSALKWAKRGNIFKNKVIFISDKEVKQGLDNIKKEKIDFIILDLPPELSMKALKAAMLADFCLVPCQASTLDLESAEETIEFLETIKKPFWLFPSNIKKGTSIGKKLPDTLRQLGNTIDIPIHNKVSIVEAAMLGEWIGKYKPKSEEHLEYRRLAEKVVQIAKGEYKDE